MDDRQRAILQATGQLPGKLSDIASNIASLYFDKVNKLKPTLDALGSLRTPEGMEGALSGFESKFPKTGLFGKDQNEVLPTLISKIPRATATFLGADPESLKLNIEAESIIKNKLGRKPSPFGLNYFTKDELNKLTPEEKQTIKRYSDRSLMAFGGSTSINEISKAIPAKTGVGDVLYHGGKTDFDKFDISRHSKGSGGDLFGRGAYLTDSEDVANFYANEVSKKDYITDYKMTGPLGTEEPVFAKNADELAKKNAKVTKWSTKDLNMLDAQNHKLTTDELKPFIDDLQNRGFSKAEATDEINRYINYARKNSSKINNYRGELEYLIKRTGVKGDDVANVLKSKGYDGIKYPADQSFEGKKNAYNYVVYNVNKLKKNITQQPLKTGVGDIQPKGVGR